MNPMYGLQYDVMPTDVVMNRKCNPDGSITKIMWMEGESYDYVRQAYDSPAPLSAIKGTKKIVRRVYGPTEVVDL